MRPTLDHIIKVRSGWVAVLSDCTVSTHRANGAVFVSGQKRPLAVLIKQGATTKVFGPEGTPMTFEDLEARYPGAWRTVMEAQTVT